MGLLLTALDLEGEDGRAAVGEVFLVQSVVGMVRQAGMVHMLHLGMVRQEFHHLLGVLRMAVQAQREGFHALKQQERVEGGDGGARIPQEDGADIGDKGGGAGGVHKADAVVAWVRFSDGGIPTAGLPVELAAIHDDAAQGGTVAADELGGGVDHDVSAMLNGADQIGRAEGVVNHQRQAVLMGNLGDGVDVGDVAVGIAQGLQIDGLGVVLNGVLHFCQIMGVHESSGDAELGQGVGQQVVAAAVDGLLGDDVVAGLG